MKGKLIVIDGNDGSGKHTQTEKVRSTLLAMKKRVLLISFPRYQDTFFGRELRKALDGKYGDFANLDAHIASQLYAADRWASRHTMLQALRAGTHVVCDRYVSANQIHQGGKIKSTAKREDFLAWLDQLEFGEYKIPRPDVSIYLDVPPAISKKLMSDRTRDTVEKNPKYLENSHKSAQWLIRRNPDTWVHVRCTMRGLIRSREDIHAEIMAKLHERAIV